MATSHIPLAVGILCLVACIFLSLFAWRTARSSDQQSAEQAFAVRADQLVAAIDGRMRDYEQALRAGVGLWSASTSVSRSEWQAFTQVLQLNKSYPGIQGVGFITLLRGEDDITAFTRKQRLQGYDDYAVFPAGTRNLYGAITYLEPLDIRNRRALGFDLLTEPVRREAMLRARDSGKPALSGRVVLLQETEENKQQGALLFLPVYAQLPVPDDLGARRSALVGWVYSPFRMSDLMRGTLEGLLTGLRLQVFDGDTTAPSQRLFDSLRDGETEIDGYSATRPIDIAGHRWTLVVSATDAFALDQKPWATFVLLTGLAISALVFVVVMTLLRSEARARQIASSVSQAFHEAEGRHLAIVQAASEAILTIDESGIVRTFSAGAERIFNFPAEEVIGHDIALLIADHERGATKDFLRRFFAEGAFSVSRRETIGRRKGGEEFSAAASLGLLVVAKERHVVVLLQDVTDRKIAEAALAEADHMQKLLFGAVPYPIIATRTDGIISFVNQAAEIELGYSASELIGLRSIESFHLQDEVLDLKLSRSRYGAKALTAPSTLEVLTADCAARGSSEREWTYLRKGGSFPALVTTSRVSDRAGVHMGFIFLIVDISERKEAEHHIHHLAHHDSLTDLPNRTLLKERLSSAVGRAAASGVSVGVLMLDLDHFKRINDTLGHGVGDGLLVEISARLRSLVRREDTVARMGGDEFVIVLAGAPNAERVEDIATKIVERVFTPVQVGGHELQVSGSVGIALYPRDGSDEGTLLRNADAAMYVAKGRGRANFQWYSPSMMQIAEEKMLLEVDLRKAIDANQLRLGYQPIVCLQTGKVLGLEALLRWPHPDRGLISPEIFVPLAEEAGLIVRLGEWVLQEACRFWRQLEDQSGRRIPISVNVSPRQLAEPNFVQRVHDISSSYGMPGDALTLEITESIMVDRPEEARTILGDLRSNGTQIAIDDFGTGYSSLSYITRFPVDKLKIDRSFISGVGGSGSDDAIATAIIAMARSLRLEVIAEGVESMDQLQFLIEQQCHAAQGFLFGEMASIAEVLAFDASKSGLRKKAGSTPRNAADAVVTLAA